MTDRSPPAPVPASGTVGVIVHHTARPPFRGREGAAVALLIALAVLAPPIPLPAGLPDVRVEQALAVPAALWLAAAWRRGAPPRLGAVDAAFGALAVATCLSIAYARLALAEPAGVRDGYEVVKLGIYWVLYRAGLAAGGTGTGRRTAYLALLLAGSLSALVALAQYFDPLDIGGRTGGLWAAAHHLRVLARDGRAFGTAANANYFGMLMALVVVAALCLRAGGSAAHPADRHVASVALVLGSLGVVLSGSRGALAALAVGVPVVVAVRPAARRPPPHAAGAPEREGSGAGDGRPRLAPSLALLCGAFVVAVLVVELLPRGREDYLTRLAGTLGRGADTDLALRLERWRSFLPWAGEESEGGAYLRNGGLEAGTGDRANAFRALPGTVYRRAPEAARTGGYGLVFRGNPEAPSQRAAVYQQRHLGFALTGALAASVWVRLAGASRGTVELYVNVYYADGGRRDPYARVAADPARPGEWQRLNITVRPDAGRTVDFVGVYLLSDDFSGEAHADDFALVEDTGPAPTGAAGAATADGGDAGAAFRRSPVFGVGPRKEAGSGAVDNEYLEVASRSGLVGLAAYLALWGAVLVTAVRVVRQGTGNGGQGATGAVAWSAVAVAAIVAGLLVFNLVAGSLYQMQLIDVFWPLAGASLAPEQNRS